MNKFKNIVIGINNKISKNTIHGSNIKIGNNNIIYPGVKIFENTIIGDNNVILSGNILGEYPVHSSCEYKDLKKNGLIIGNNNFFHINNVIFSGFNNKTIIGNNNKLLGELHIGHDVEINNFVNIYPRTILSGYVKLLNYSGIGISTSIHQNVIIGQYSFIGMNNTITKNVFPFFININNKLHRLNKKRIEENLDFNYLLNNENNLRELNKINNDDIYFEFIKDNFKDNNLIHNILKDYYSIIKKLS